MLGGSWGLSLSGGVWSRVMGTLDQCKGHARRFMGTFPMEK